MELSEMSNQQNREELASKFRSFFVEVMNLAIKKLQKMALKVPNTWLMTI